MLTNESYHPRLHNFRKLCHDFNLPYYRTGTPSFWTTEDVLLLKENLNICEYFDLRTSLEQRNCNFYKTHIANNIKHTSAPLDMTGDSFFDHTNPSALDYANYYVKMLPKALIIAETLFNKARKIKSNLMFGCSAGKDRTGIVALLLLKMHEVPNSAIVHDYMLSLQPEENYSIFYDENMEKKIPYSKFVQSMTPKEYTIQIVLDHIDRHGC
jgi:protein tyrosine/serine phosphatase